MQLAELSPQRHSDCNGFDLVKLQNFENISIDGKQKAKIISWVTLATTAEDLFFWLSTLGM
jgi:hypothetical protein